MARIAKVKNTKEKNNALHNKLKKPEFQEDETLKNEIEFLNFVLEKSN